VLGGHLTLRHGETHRVGDLRERRFSSAHLFVTMRDRRGRPAKGGWDLLAEESLQLAGDKLGAPNRRQGGPLPGRTTLALSHFATVAGKVVADPARLAIVRRLASGPARVTDLACELGLAQSIVSGHLACLRDCGLVTARPAGRASVYSLAPPSLAELLAAAEGLLAATGNAVALCPVCGQDR